MPALKSRLTGGKLRVFRTERHLTCQEMADTMGVSRSCYTHWERGEAPISMHAEKAIENWKAIVSMGGILAIEGRIDELESLGLSSVLMAEIIQGVTK